MDGENGRRLTTDDRGETFGTPTLVNSESSSSNRTEWEGNGRISVSSHNDHAEPLHKNGKTTAPVEASFRLEPESIKNSSGESFKPTDSPHIQVMERTKSPDHKNSSAGADSPNRWSVDSNDSLFSIGMGNDSFSKDVSLTISGDICTTGELSLSDAYLPRVSHRSPPAKVIDEPIKEFDEPVETDSNLSGSMNPNASHHHSDDSKVRNEAFASALTTMRACPLCGSLCCGKMKCCCRWPSCKWFGWPSCSNDCLRWPSCCRCCCTTCCCSKLISASCCSWKRETKRPRSDSAYSLMEKNVTSSSKHRN